MLSLVLTRTKQLLESDVILSQREGEIGKAKEHCVKVRQKRKWFVMMIQTSSFDPNEDEKCFGQLMMMSLTCRI